MFQLSWFLNEKSVLTNLDKGVRLFLEKIYEFLIVFNH